MYHCVTPELVSVRQMSFSLRNGALHAQQAQAKKVELERRIALLEDSPELCNIYNHPHWVKFMELVKAAKTPAARQKLRDWSRSHHQIAPLLDRFHRCTRNFGLTFDVCTFVPPSRLLYQQYCRHQITLHRRQAQEHERHAAHYEELLRSCTMTSPSTISLPESEGSTDEDSNRSCWSVLTDSTPRLSTGIAMPANDLWTDHGSASAPGSQFCDPEPLQLPPALSESL